MTTREWLRAYAQLALRVNRRLTAGTGGTMLIYQGPVGWSDEVTRESPPPAQRLVEDADRLLEQVPFDAERAAYVSAHVRAMRAVARRLGGEQAPLRDYARRCLGVDVEWVPEEVFEAAHDQLDVALPKTGGSVAERLNAWQAAHTLDDVDRLPGVVGQAVHEARARTSAIITLPADEVVDCTLVPDAAFLAAGHYAGGHRSTIFVNSSLPFNLADLLSVVTHEGHPGHIAESLLKDIHLVGDLGRGEQQVRFMLSPSFVVSEGLGLHAQELIFPDDEAQVWLANNVFPDYGIDPDGSDLATIHEARNMLWGVWANAALLADEGRSEADVAGYLSRWALLGEHEVGPALASLRAPGMEVYVLGYYHGWRLLRTWLDAGDRQERVRRLLTEQVLLADLR